MNRKNQTKTKKSIIILIISLLTATTVLAIAYQQKKASKSNVFTLGKAKSEIMENFDKEKNIKKDVSIQNTGNISSYIRVAILYNFQDKEGNIIETSPIKEEDYTIKFASSNDWIYKDGYYYYKYKINENEKTTTLIEECKPIKEYTDKTFSVDIIVQAIQAEPSRAVIEAWNVDIENEMIV